MCKWRESIFLLWRIFFFCFFAAVCFLIWSIKWMCKQIVSKKKNYFGDKSQSWATIYDLKNNYVSCFMNLVLNSPQKKIDLLMVVLFSLELAWTNWTLPVISWFLKTFPESYLGVSHFSHPPIFRKQAVLDMALIICIT